jgi:hypothetical protein
MEPYSLTQLRIIGKFQTGVPLQYYFRRRRDTASVIGMQKTTSVLRVVEAGHFSGMAAVDETYVTLQTLATSRVVRKCAVREPRKFSEFSYQHNELSALNQ